VRPLPSAAAAQHVVLGARLEYRCGALTEWFVKSPKGLEQGFTLRVPPAGRAGHDAPAIPDHPRFGPAGAAAAPWSPVALRGQSSTLCLRLVVRQRENGAWRP
jgi:hypothetical protein